MPELGEFDETLGAGSDTPWGAEEDTEYSLRAITQGFSILYDSHLTIYHPDPIVKYAASACPRTFSYGAGVSRVLRKHLYPLSIVGYQWLHPLAGMVPYLAGGRLRKAQYHLAVLRGRVLGDLAC
jgi:GT2 family glycosyltransferase